MHNYIKYFPTPFLDDLVASRCVPFIGAGFSKNATIPDGKSMPLWEDIGKEMANAITDYEYTGAVDAISAYEYEYASPKLIEELQRSLLVDCAQPGTVHKSFCELPFDLVVTTNFEFLLEKGYENVNRYCRPIIDEDQLSIDSSTPEVKLLKLHGDLHHPTRLVATEKDYDVFLDNNPLLATYLANLLIAKTAFFIGYSLDDPDFRQIWQVIGERLGNLRRYAYTIAVSAPAHSVARFERRGVKVINIPGDSKNYSEILKDVFDQLREYWTEKILEYSTSTADESLAELSLPKSKTSRLCFFSVPSRLSAYYKALVFPIAENNGFVPVLAVDIISPGDSITAKIAALLDRTEIAIIDTSSRGTQIELKMALSKARLRNRVFLIIEEGANLPADFQEANYIYRPKGEDSAKEQFLTQLDEFFKNIAIEILPELSAEPERLLKHKEYRASVISAIALLESILRPLIKEKQPDRAPFISMTKLIRAAIGYELIPQNKYEDLREAIQLRNTAVHMAGDIIPKQARKIVRDTLAIVNAINESKAITS